MNPLSTAYCILQTIPGQFVYSSLSICFLSLCFATCFAGTYETDRHFWIPLLLISIMMPVCVLSAVAYIGNWFPIYAHCILLIVLNIGGSLLLIIVTKCNIRLHNSYSTLEHHGLYSLSERFQVSENIKTCQWLSRIQGSILFFNVACVSILILEYVSMNDKLIIVANVSFNILCTIYAAVTPIVVIIYTPEWTRETIRLWHLLFPPTNCDHLDLRTTFGEEMSYSDKNIESKVYFEQLQKNLTKQAMEKSKKKQRSSSWNNSEHEIFL
ncbi:CBN-SRE-6 protein [Caenorhabditis brenneri]|uniref:CBN-SRE-6 protein n=1 Tax=Caenorhabditis brenneri TaxID=135651 RepID=G0N8S7_CAEBE|nr:CBN-SRE-6 protein [Caenorhabditis brenneri]